jgi:hypothetical protein
MQSQQTKTLKLLRTPQKSNKRKPIKKETQRSKRKKLRKKVKQKKKKLKLMPNQLVMMPLLI